MPKSVMTLATSARETTPSSAKAVIAARQRSDDQPRRTPQLCARVTPPEAISAEDRKAARHKLSNLVGMRSM